MASSHLSSKFADDLAADQPLRSTKMVIGRPFTPVIAGDARAWVEARLVTDARRSMRAAAAVARSWATLTASTLSPLAACCARHGRSASCCWRSSGTSRPEIDDHRLVGESSGNRRTPRQSPLPPEAGAAMPRRAGVGPAQPQAASRRCRRGARQEVLGSARGIGRAGSGWSAAPSRSPPRMSTKPAAACRSQACAGLRGGRGLGRPPNILSTPPARPRRRRTAGCRAGSPGSP